MLGHQFAYSAAPIRKVKEVQFGILAPEEIVSLAHVAPYALLVDSFDRKHTRLQKSNLLRLWMKQRTSLRSAA